MERIPNMDGLDTGSDGIDDFRTRFLKALVKEAASAKVALLESLGGTDGGPGGFGEWGVAESGSNFHLGAVLEQGVEGFRPVAKRKGIQFHLEQERDVPTLLHGDVWKLRQVISLILGRLSGSVEETVISLVVSLEESTIEGARLRFVVRAGRPEGPGESLDVTETEDQALARALVSSLGGELVGPRLTEAGLEAQFILTFFRAAGEQTAEPPFSGSRSGFRKGSGATDPQSRRVLVVEDNRVTQMATRLLLEKRGHVVDVAADGKTAVERVGAKLYDVVLMDLEMPLKDGIQATVEIRDLAEAGPAIVAYTAHTQLEDRRLCLEAGVDGFLAKPVSSDDLFRAVERWPRRSDA